MKLPEAIALMLEGKVMALDRRIPLGDSLIVRADERVAGLCAIEWYSRFRREWNTVQCIPLDGWREATPQELKEIGA